MCKPSQSVKQAKSIFVYEAFDFINSFKVIFCLFGLILYVPSTIFQLNRDGSSWDEPALS